MDRSRFHLHRAQVHLQSNNPSHALRHLRKCGARFGAPEPPPAPPAPPAKPRPSAVAPARNTLPKFLRGLEHAAHLRWPQDTEAKSAYMEALETLQKDKQNPTPEELARLPEPARRTYGLGGFRCVYKEKYGTGAEFIIPTGTWWKSRHRAP